MLSFTLSGIPARPISLKLNRGDIDTRTDLRGAGKELREKSVQQPAAELVQLLTGLQDEPGLVSLLSELVKAKTVRVLLESF